VAAAADSVEAAAAGGALVAGAAAAAASEGSGNAPARKRVKRDRSASTAKALEQAQRIKADGTNPDDLVRTEIYTLKELCKLHGFSTSGVKADFLLKLWSIYGQGTNMQSKIDEAKSNNRN
jgi:hypothetical protein